MSDNRNNFRPLDTGVKSAQRCSLLAMHSGMFDCLDSDMRTAVDVPHAMISLYFSKDGWRSLKLEPAEAMRLGARLIDLGLSLYSPGAMAALPSGERPATSPPPADSTELRPPAFPQEVQIEATPAVTTPPDEQVTCGELLRQACRNECILVNTISAELGVHEITIARWRNDHAIPRFKYRKALCELLRISPKSLELAITWTRKKRRFQKDEQDPARRTALG